MDMQESKADVKKTTPPSEWFKNVAKSIGYSSSEIVKSVTPNIHNFIADNTSYAQELVSTVRDSRDQSKSIFEMMNLGTHANIAKSALSNALEDIKSGKIYNKERMESFGDDDEFGAFMAEMEDGFGASAGDTEDSSSTTVINNLKVVKEDNTRLTATVEAAANATMKGTESLLRQNSKVATASMALNHDLAMGITKGLETVNSNIAQLVNFQNDSMAKYVGASIKYYDESLGVMKNSLDKLIAMAPEQKQERRIKDDPYDMIFGGGGFSLRGYAQNVKSNYGVLKDENQIIQMIDSILSDDTSNLERLAKSPLTFIADTFTKKIIPMTVRSTMEQVDRTFTAFMPAMMDRFSRMGKDGNLITETIGRLFGVDTSVKSKPNMAGYMRGAVPFDGETKRAITDIIPTYLRKMYAHMTGTKEFAFDFEQGKWSELEEMKKAYDDQRLGSVRSGYSEQMSKMDEMIQAVKFESKKQQEDFKTGMGEFFYNLARSSENVAFDRTTPEREKANRAKIKEIHSFDNPAMNDILFSMLTNLSKTDQVELVGSGRYNSIKNMREFIKSAEESPTFANAMTLLTGLKHDDHIEKDADGKISKVNPGGIGGGRTDAYGNNDLFYLRGIMQTLVEGIRVFPEGPSGGKKSPTSEVNTGLNIGDRLTKFREQKIKASKVEATTLINHDLDKANENLDIVVGDLAMGANLPEELAGRLKHNREMEEQAQKKAGIFGRLTGNKPVGQTIDELVNKPAQILKGAFEKIDGTLYNLVFGINENGNGSFMNITLDRMTEMISKVGDFATDKIFLPAAEFVTKLYTKGSEAVKENPIVQGIKDGVKYWFVGEKDEEGNRKGGVFSDLMNSTKDTIKSISHTITGIGYTDSQGKTHAKKEDSVFGQMKGMVSGIFSETKKHFFGDKDATDPDKRIGMMTRVTDMLGDGMSDWSSMLFGTERDPNRTGTEILKHNTTQFIKSAPKGFAGAGGGFAIGTALAAGTGILGSFLFPGAPVALALTGGALGMATGFEGFNKWAFGSIGGNGERIGGALVSANTRQFIKDNKSKLVGGAVGGVIASMAIPAVADMVIPGSGALINMLSPFGPIGAAIQGIATAFIMKSDTVSSWLFGPKNMDGERTGGLLTRMFKKPSDEVSKRSVKSKLGLAAVGIAGGALLSSMTGIGVGSALSGLGWIGTLIASPFGPVGGAIMGLAAAIALGSDRVRTMLFGKKDDDADVQDVGFIGRMFNMMNMEVLKPMKNTITGIAEDLSNWFKNKFMADVAFVTEPIIRTVKDTITGSLKLFKGLVWDIPKFLATTSAKLIGGAIGKIRDALSDTIIDKAIIKPAGAMVKGAATLIVRPLRFFAETTMKAAVGLAKAGESIQNGFLMIPALMKMGFDRTFETGKALFKGIGKLFSSKDEEGNDTGQSFSGRARGWWQDAREEGRSNSSYVTTLFQNRKESIERYKQGKAENKAKRQQRKDEWKVIAQAARDNRYNVDGMINMSEEDTSIANALKLTRSKQIKDRQTIDKFQVEVFKGTGLTLNQLLGLHPNKPIEILSRDQLKYVKMVLERSKKMGLKGDDLKKDQKLIDYKMTEIDLAEGTYDETKKIRELLEHVGNNLDVMFGHASNNQLSNLTQEATQNAQESVLNAAQLSSDYKMMFEQFNATGQTAAQQISPFSNPNFKAQNQAEEEVEQLPKEKKSLRQHISEMFTGHWKKKKNDDEESEGGAFGGIIGKAVSSATSKVTSMMSGMTREVSKLGCGAIVLSKVLAEAGVKMSANDIYQLAEEKGLANPGVGISSNVFKVIASMKGLTYSYAKPSKQSLTNLFAKTNMVIARLSSGVGHYVILHSYSANDNSVAIDDPMGKVSGVYDVEQVIKMSTHFYVVYKKGIGSIFKTIANTTRGTSEVSMGGASAATTPAKVDNRVKSSTDLIDMIRRIGALPVIHFKSKEDLKKEKEMEDRLKKGQGGDDDLEMTGRAEESEGPFSSMGKLGRFMNRFSPFRLLGKLFSGLGGLVGGLFGRGRNGTRGNNRRGGLFGGGRNNTTGSRGLTSGAGGTRAAGGRGGLIGGALSVLGGIGRTVAKVGGFALGGAKKLVNGLIGGPNNTGAKVAQELLQQGNTASRANVSALNRGYKSSANPGSFMKDGLLDVNNFLKQQYEKSAATVEATFRGTMVDLSTRIEINTRNTAQMLGELLDATTRFQDWLQDYLNNFDPCCPSSTPPIIIPPIPPTPPNPKPKPEPKPQPEPKPLPIDDVVPQPDPKPVPKPVGDPVPLPIDNPWDVPWGEPVADPVADPIKEKNPWRFPLEVPPIIPIPLPARLPSRKPAPVPQPAPQPTPQPRPQPTPQPRPQPVPTPADPVRKPIGPEPSPGPFRTPERPNPLPTPADPTRKPAGPEPSPSPFRTPQRPNPRPTPAEPAEKPAAAASTKKPVRSKGGMVAAAAKTAASSIGKVAGGVVDGVKGGLKSAGGAVMSSAKSVGKSALSGLKGLGNMLGGGSPAPNMGFMSGGAANAGRLAGNIGDVAGDVGKVGGSLLKGLGKTGAKFLGGGATGGAIMAGMTAMDVHYGYNNAGKILKMDPDKVTAKHKAAASTAQSVVGFIPFVDTIDEMLGGHAKKFVGDLVLGTDKVWTGLKSTVSTGWDAVSSGVSTATNFIGTKTGEAWNATKDVASVAWDGVKTGVSTATDFIGTKTGEAWNATKDVASVAWDGVKTGVSTATDFIGTKTTDIWNGTKDIASTAWDGVKTGVSTATSFIGTKTTEIWNGTKDIASTAWDGVKTGVSTATNLIGTKTTEIWNGTKDIASTAWDGVKTAVSTATSFIGTKTKEVWNGTKDLASAGWDTVKKGVSTATTAITTKTSEAWSATKNLASTGWDTVKKGVSTAATTIASTAGTKWNNIKKDIGTKWDETKTNVTGKLKTLASDASTKWESIKSEASSKFEAVKKSVGTKLDKVNIPFSGLGTEIASAVKGKITSAIGSLKVKIFGSGETISIVGDMVGAAVDKAKDTGKAVANTAVKTVKKTGSAVKNAGKSVLSKFGLGGPELGDNAVDELMDNIDEEYGAGGGCAPCKNKKKREETRGMGGPEVDGAYFSQKDSRWSGKLLAGGTSFGDAGCGPTAIANVVTDLTGQQTLPTEALQHAQSKGFVDPLRGTSSELFGSFAKEKGVEVGMMNPDTENIRSQLARGNKVILRGQNGDNYTKAGHYIIADGLTPDGNVKVKDPMGKDRSGSYSLDQISRGLTNAFVATTGAGIPKYAGKIIYGAGKIKLTNPLPKGKLTSPFGWRTIDGQREFHWGIDLATPGGESMVQAAADGVVVFSGTKGTYGNCIIIRHDFDGQEINTVYAHMSSRKVGEGAKVKQGQSLGMEGATGRSFGTHLHFEVHKGPYNYTVNNVDPLKAMSLEALPGKAFEGVDVGNLTTGMNSAASADGSKTEDFSGKNAIKLFSAESMLPAGISSIGSIMEAASDAFFFGSPIAGIAAAASKLLGGNSSSSSADLVDTSNLNGSDVAEKAWNFFKQHGYSDAATAGILGNWQQESSMNPASVSSNNATGIAQWLGGRRDNMKASASSKGINWSDLGHQLAWTKYELEGGDSTTVAKLKPYGGLSGFKALSDAERAAVIFDETFERSGASQVGKRKSYAQRYYELYSKKGIGGPLLDMEGVGNNNIYDIMKQADMSSFGEGMNKARVDASRKVFGEGCNCSGKGGPDEMEAITKIQKDFDQVKVHAKGIGSIDQIEQENVRLHDHNVRSENVRFSADNNSTTVFASGGNDAWTVENVTRAISSLETIADNTQGVKDGINNVSAHITTDNSTTNVSPNGKQGAVNAPRGINAVQNDRNKKILAGRK